MIDERLLEVRKTMKRRKPNFHIQNSNDPKKRFAGRWKRPKGLQNKMRERRRGNPRYVEPGYGSPSAVRGASPAGLFPVVVSNVEQLSSIRPGEDGVVIGSTVGMRKRAAIVKAAVDKKLTLLNFDAAEISKKIDAAIASRKKRRQEVMGRKKSKAASKKTVEAKPAENIENVVDDEAKKKAEKAEKDKVLTKAQ